MENLKTILHEAVRGYATRALNGQNYFVTNEDQTVLSVLFIGKVRDEHIADASLIARLEGEYIIVEQDKTNKPLVDVLLEAGIPREKIVLTYMGEELQTA